MEGHQVGPGSEHLAAEGQHLATEDVVLQRHPSYLDRGLRGRTRLGADDLQADPLVHATPVRTPQQQRRAALTLGDEVDRADHAGAHRRVRPARDVDRRHLARAGTPRLLRSVLQQVGQPELAVLEAGHPHHLVVATRLGQPRLEPGLDVHVVVGAPGLRDDGDVGGQDAQVVPQRTPEGGAEVGAGRAQDTTQGPPPEPCDVGQLRPVAPLRSGRRRHRPGKASPVPGAHANQPSSCFSMASPTVRRLRSGSPYGRTVIDGPASPARPSLPAPVPAASRLRAPHRQDLRWGDES